MVRACLLVFITARYSHEYPDLVVQTLTQCHWRYCMASLSTRFSVCWPYNCTLAASLSNEYMITCRSMECVLSSQKFIPEAPAFLPSSLVRNDRLVRSPHSSPSQLATANAARVDLKMQGRLCLLLYTYHPRKQHFSVFSASATQIPVIFDKVASHDGNM